MNLKELHIEFLKRYNKKIGLSKFCELRSKWCIAVDGASGLHTVCVCEYHQNFKLLASKMFRSCDQCPTMNSFRTYLLELFDMHETENLSYYL